jgi:Zn-dependent peptidase ImmA (M78 family)/DNA-binding XRE family transcriptional regulator
MGLSLRDLGERVALSHAAIKKYEDNEVIPSSDVLIRLAKALDVKVEYFFRPELFTLDNIQYRKHSDMSKQEVDEITARMLDQIERRVELENLFPRPPIEAFKMDLRKVRDPNDIDAVAAHVREQWALGTEPLPDLIDIFEERGVKVFEVDNQKYPRFDGLSANINEIPIIVIGDQWPGDRQRFTLTHELGHLILSHLKKIDFDEESWCNRFAGAFLLPKSALVSILGQYRNNIEPRELSLLKQEFGISMQGILHCAEDAGIISNELYRQLRREFKEKGWDKHEPGEQYPNEKTHIFEQMVFHALAEEYIGESKAAELMNITLEQFRSFRAMESVDVVVRHQ